MVQLHAGDIQESIEFASDITSQQNLAKVPGARAYAMAELSKAGVQFYAPNEAEMEQWVAKAGHQLSDWDAIKTELAGSKATFDKLLEAANTQGRLYVHDV